MILPKAQHSTIELVSGSSESRVPKTDHAPLDHSKSAQKKGAVPHRPFN
jgi:hypothetical protein